MSDFPKVAALKIDENVYDIIDNTGRAALDAEKAKTLNTDAILLNNKTQLAEAITARGITTAASDSLLKMAENIDAISGGSKKALTNLVQYSSVTLEHNSSVRYAYPWLNRVWVNQNMNVANNVGSMQYETDNANVKSLIFVTRFKRFNSRGNTPAMFCSGLIDVDVQLFISDGNYKIGMKLNKDIVINVDASKYLTDEIADFYVKVEQLNEGNNTVRVNIYTAAADIDGNPEEFELIAFREIIPETLGNKVVISLLGMNNTFINSVLYTELGSPRQDGGYYGNYLPETCIAMQDDAEIFKVVCGSSSLYPTT